METDVESNNNKLNEALAKAIGEFPEITTNKMTKYEAKGRKIEFHWADIGHIRKTVNPILSKYGLFASQDVKAKNGEVSVQTTVGHESGLERKSDWITFYGDKDPKGMAGLITYAARYQLTAYLSIPIYEGEDIDEQGDEEPQQPKQIEKPPIAHLRDVVDASNGLWSMPEVERAYFQKYGQPWPPCEKEHWAELYNMVRLGVDPKEVLK